MKLPLIIGLAVLGAVWIGPLPELARSAFSAHMAMHMGVVAVASAFLAVSIAGSRYDPTIRWPALSSPITASFAELIVVWTWHAPALHHFARSSTTGIVLEQGTFLLAGLWLWISAVGGGEGRPTTRAKEERTASLKERVASRKERRKDFPLHRQEMERGSRRGAGVAGLLLTSMHMTLLGALLALTPRPLYPHLGGVAGLSPLEDQHLGGAIMLLVGGLAYLLGGLWLTAGLLRTNSPRGRAHTIVPDVANSDPAPAPPVHEPEGRL